MLSFGCVSIPSDSENHAPDPKMRVELTDSSYVVRFQKIPHTSVYYLKLDESERVRLTFLDSRDRTISVLYFDVKWNGWSCEDTYIGMSAKLSVDPVTGEIWAQKGKEVMDIVVGSHGHYHLRLNIDYENSPSTRDWNKRVSLTENCVLEEELLITAP